jgi:hypothetical protein
MAVTFSAAGHGFLGGRIAGGAMRGWRVSALRRPGPFRLRRALYAAAHHRCVSKSAILLAVSRHAARRLAERANVRTVEDLLTCVQSLRAVSLALMHAPDEA